jgi:spermidine/putrescine transport system ATP-binding protein
MSSVLSLRGIEKSFTTSSGVAKVLHNLSLHIQENAFLTLLGPSGCGKTTLLRIIAGLESADCGEVLLDGSDISHLPPHRRPINTVFQNYALFPHMSVRDNIAFGLRMRRRKPEEIAEAVLRGVRLVQMEQYVHRMPSQLSGGQQQRVALARALVNEPRILLLDEPLSALDFKLRREMQEELKRLQRDTGITFVFVTHDQSEALSLSDHIVVMDRGSIEQMGEPESIYRRPASRFVATFIGECNFIPAASIGMQGAELAFRPEDVALDCEAGSSESGSALGFVKEVTYKGASTHYRVRFDCGIDIIVVDTQQRVFQAGERVRARIRREGLMRW